MKQKLIFDIILLGIGGFGYGALEVIARGHTHPSMLLAGGICLIIISKIIAKKRFNFVVSALLCATAITAVEFVFGCIFNLLLKMKVWDYSNQPFNLFGQICPQFFLIWLFVSAVIIIFCDIVAKRKRKTKA